MKKKLFLCSWLVILLIGCKQLPDTFSSKTTPGELAFSLRYNPTESRHEVGAHRGGKGYMGYPENCIETIAYLAQQEVSIFEIDIAKTSDNQLVLMHDDNLKRTTTGQGKIEAMTFEKLQQYYLIDDYKKITTFKVPLLRETLSLALEKDLIMMLDFKDKSLYAPVIDMIRTLQAEKNVVLISYNPKQAEVLHRMAPDLMLSVSIKNNKAYDRHKALHIPDDKMIAFVGISEPPMYVYHFLHEKGIMCTLGALGNLDRRAVTRGDQVYEALWRNGADLLSSDRPIEASQTIPK